MKKQTRLLCFPRLSRPRALRVAVHGCPSTWRSKLTIKNSPHVNKYFKWKLQEVKRDSNCSQVNPVLSLWSPKQWNRGSGFESHSGHYVFFCIATGRLSYHGVSETRLYKTWTSETLKRNGKGQWTKRKRPKYLTKIRKNIISLSLKLRVETVNFYHSFIHQWLYSPLLGSGLFFGFVIFFYTVGRTPRTGDQPVARPLPIHRTTQT
jgi:hypothetical protein